MSDTQEERSVAELDDEIARLRKGTDDRREAKNEARRLKYQSSAQKNYRLTGTAANLLPSKSSNNQKPAKKRLQKEQPSSKKFKSGAPKPALAAAAGPSHACILSTSFIFFCKSLYSTN